MKKLNSIQIFIIRALILYIVWLVVFYQWGVKSGGIDDKMTELTSYTSIHALQLINHNATGEWISRQEAREQQVIYAHLSKEAKSFLISVDGVDTVAVGNRCNALFTIALYIGFILAYPGKWMPKFLFIIFGSAIIFSANIIRIIALSFNSLYSPETLDFNHKYTYTFVVYSVVFIFWMWWVNKYSYIAYNKQI